MRKVRSFEKLSESFFYSKLGEGMETHNRGTHWHTQVSTQLNRQPFAIRSVLALHVTIKMIIAPHLIHRYNSLLQCSLVLVSLRANRLIILLNFSCFRIAF